MPKPVIDADYLTERLSRLLNIPSPTGYTDEAVWEVCRELERLGLSFDLTRRGAIRAKLPGKDAKPARALVAHVDTLGAQVKRIKENGRLEVVPIGHWSSRFAEGARATIFSEGQRFRGTILPLKASATPSTRRSTPSPWHGHRSSCASTSGCRTARRPRRWV